MLFFFKEKPIEIVAYLPPDFQKVMDFNPIVSAKELLPDWWKNTPSSTFNWDSFTPNNTSKSCPGIIQSLTTGFILPMWCDLAIETTSEGYRYHYSDKKSVLGSHANTQIPGFYEDYFILKIDSPWIISSPVNLLYTSPFYHNDTAPYITPTGIITPVSNACATNIFIFVKKDKSKIMIKTGTPLMHIIPLTDKKVKFKRVTLNIDEYTKKQSSTSFMNFFSGRGIKNMAIQNKRKS